MSATKSDIRLIDGDVTTVAEAVKEYLFSVGFEIDQEEITPTNADIKASNSQRSVINLFLLNSPQLVNFRIEQKPDEKVQIQSKFELFNHFRFFHYTCLIILLSFFSFSFCMYLNSNFYQFISSVCLSGLFLHRWLYLLSFIFFSISSVFFIIKRDSADSKELFIKEFYETLHKKNFVNENLIQDNVSIQDLLKSSFLFIIFSVATLFLSSSPLDFIDKFPNTSIVLGVLITVASILLVIVFTIVLKPFIGEKGTFLLLGLVLCIPITVHSNTPVLLSFPEKLNQVLEKYNKIERAINSDSAKMAIWQKYKNSDNGMKGAMIFIPILYFGLWMAIFLFAAFCFINIIESPIHIIRNQKHFSSNHKDSFYNKSLQPKNTSYIFNLLIFFLWATISVALIFGLYFTLTIFERTISGSNFIFNSELAILFFENTKTAFSIFLQSISDINTPPLFYKILMITYILPILIPFVFVLRKNLKSTIEGYFLIKKPSNEHKLIEKRLAEITKEICKSANTRAPAIRVIDSSNIIAETKYIGFPIFKNILIISMNTWNEFHAVEDELNALLAHEILHIKKHTLMRKIFCFLSDYSLFGNGFLSLLQNSYKIEKEADDFAVKWLIKKHQDKYKAISSLKSLLERIEEVNWSNTIFQSNNSFNFAMCRKDSYRNELLKTYDNSSKIDKLKINLKLLYQMYFGEEILSYFHPSTIQRIIWAEEKYSTNEAN